MVDAISMSRPQSRVVVVHTWAMCFGMPLTIFLTEIETFRAHSAKNVNANREIMDIPTDRVPFKIQVLSWAMSIITAIYT